MTTLSTSLLSSINAASAFSPFYSASNAFANPTTLATAAQSALLGQAQFPSLQTMALAGLFSQAIALNQAAATLAPGAFATPLLSDSLNPLSSLPYTQTAATSSNSAAVTAVSQPGATVASYQIGVSQLAVGQVDQGTVAASGGSALNGGTITITQGSTTTTLSFAAGPDRGSTLVNAAAAINQANLGLTASVSASGGPPATAFTITVMADRSGTANEFTLADGSSNLVARTGLSTTTSAQDGAYTVDNIAYGITSGNLVSGAPGYNAANGNATVSLDNGRLTLDLLATTSSDATVSVAASSSSLAAQATSLASAYDAFQSFLANNSAYLNPSLAQEAQDAVQSNAAKLAAIGITASNSGSAPALAVSQSVLSTASPAAIQSALSGTQGLADRLSGLANLILTTLQQQLSASAPVAANTSLLATGLAPEYVQLLLAEQSSGGSLINVHA